MAEVYTLRYHDWQCELVPAMGACLTGLWKANLPVLRATPPHLLGSALDAASYPLVPYSNRMAQARLTWEGVQYPLQKNFLPEDHAIHGAGWMQAWTVVAADAQAITLSLQHKANAIWPFDFASEQIIRLDEAGLRLFMSVRNESALPMPAGLGWHPYFVKRAAAHLRFDATGRWEMDADQLPTHLASHRGLDQALTKLRVDHCFEGWGGSLVLSDNQMTVKLTSGFQRLVVFTKPDLDCIAIEPVSHANNAFNRAAKAGPQADAMGVCVLLPGASVSGEMRIAAQFKV